MLKKIPVSALRMGMHLHRLEGSWMAHPFWKTRFVIDSLEDLQALHHCGVAECWVDDELGLAVEVASGSEAAVVHEPAAGADAAQPAPASTHDPLAEAPQTAPTAEVRASAQAGLGAPPVQALQPGAAAPSARSLPGSAAGRAQTLTPQLPSRSADQSLQAELREAAAICGRARAAVTAMFNEARMGRSLHAEQCMPLVEDITQSVARNPGAMVSLARLKTKDDYSYMHSVAVCALMVALGRQLGLGDDDCRTAGLAGLLHDLGKVLVPEDILVKPSRLTHEEFVEIRKHPEHGHQLLLQGGNCHPAALDVVLHHHERIDGKGYPFGLAGEQLSQLARMGSVCDVYDATTSNRPYKAGWDPAESIAKMATWKGQFDESVFAGLVQSLGIDPTGSLVRLESGHLGVVTAQNPGLLVAPVVKLFFSVKSQMPVAPRVVDLSRPGTQDRIVAREARAPGQFPWLDELWADPEVLRRARAAGG